MARISDLAKISTPAGNDVFPVSDGQLTKKITLLDLKSSIVDTASTTKLGAIKVGSGLSISDTGVLSVKQFSGYVLPPATAEVLGGVRIGSGLSISETSVLSASYDLPVASNSQLGGVKIGAGLTIVDGIVSVINRNPTGGSLGDIPYMIASNATSFLSGNITATKKFLAQTGTGTTSRAPVWSTLYNYLPITLYSGQITNISVANGYLPITSRSGAITTITLIS
jgi:hypothetical protein